MRRVYNFSGGSVQFDLPADWGSACDESAISFSSPSREAALTITIYAEPPLSPAEVDRLSIERKPFGIPRSEKRTLPVQHGSGYAREFEREGDERPIYWLAHFLFFDRATVIASVNGPFDKICDRRLDFDAILGSIAVTESR